MQVGNTGHVVARALDIGLGTACRFTALLAGFRAMSCLLELGLRPIDPLITAFHNYMNPKDEDGNLLCLKEKDQTYATRFWNSIDLRQDLRDRSKTDLCLRAVGYFVLAMAVKEVTDRIFGQPIEGFNLIFGRVGIHVTPAGLPFPRLHEWKQFFAPVAGI